MQVSFLAILQNMPDMGFSYSANSTKVRARFSKAHMVSSTNTIHFQNAILFPKAYGANAPTHLRKRMIPAANAGPKRLNVSCNVFVPPNFGKPCFKIGVNYAYEFMFESNLQ